MIVVMSHTGNPAIIECVINGVIPAFRKFKCPARGPQKIIPQLSIILHPRKHVDQWFGGIPFCDACGVVNKANNSHGKADGSIWCVKRHAMCLVFVTLEKLAGNKTPNNWTVSGALTGAVYWKLFAMSIRFGTNLSREFEFEDGILQRMGMNQDNLTVNAVSSGREAGKGHKNSVVTGFGIMIKINEGSSGQLGNI